MSAPWRQYEKQIAEHFVASTTGAKVTTDEIFVGRLSGVSRKVEVVVRGTFPGYGEAMMIVDCRLWEEKVDVAEVGLFIMQVEDIGAEFGVIVTSRGFTEGAQRLARAHRGIQVLVERFEPETGEWEPDYTMCDCDWFVDLFPAMQVNTMSGVCDQCNTLWARCGCGAEIDFGDGRPRGDWFDCDGECGRQWFIEPADPRDGRDEHVIFRDEPDGVVFDL